MMPRLFYIECLKRAHDPTPLIPLNELMIPHSIRLTFTQKIDFCTIGTQRKQLKSLLTDRLIWVFMFSFSNVFPKQLKGVATCVLRTTFTNFASECLEESVELLCIHVWHRGLKVQRSDSRLKDQSTNSSEETVLYKQRFSMRFYSWLERLTAVIFCFSSCFSCSTCRAGTWRLLKRIFGVLDFSLFHSPMFRLMVFFFICAPMLGAVTTYLPAMSKERGLDENQSAILLRWVRKRRLVRSAGWCFSPQGLLWRRTLSFEALGRYFSPQGLLWRRTLSFEALGRYFCHQGLLWRTLSFEALGRYFCHQGLLWRRILSSEARDRCLCPQGFL